MVKPTHYMNIYDSTSKTNQKQSHGTSTGGACFLGQDPCQGVISQHVGPVVPVTVSEEGLLLGLLEQKDHLTRPDSENTSEPSEEVNDPVTNQS